MANELEILTENAAGDGWVDSVPGPVSTGYAAQNTNIQARTVGQDLSSVRVSGSDIILDISGPIDVDGLPFAITSQITLTPSSGGVFYIQVVAGSTSLQKSLELTSDAPTWDADKYALYNGSNRVLNWVIYAYPNTLKLLRLSDPQYSNKSLGSPVETNEINGFLRWSDMAKFIYSQYITSFGATEPVGIVVADGNAITSRSSASTIYIHDGLTAIISDSFSHPSGNTLSKLGYDGSNLIVGTSSAIYLHSGLTPTVLDTLSLNGFGGVAWDGKNLIGLSSPAGILTKYDGFSTTVIVSASIGGAQYNGIGFDGKHILVNDGTAGNIRFYDHDTLEYLGSISSSTNYWGAAYYNKKLLRSNLNGNNILIYGVSL